MKYRYRYIGPVMAFDRLVMSKWEEETVAESEKKAKNNLAYQFKKDAKLARTAKVSLPGQLLLIETVM